VSRNDGRVALVIEVRSAEWHEVVAFERRVAESLETWRTVRSGSGA
jgi:hypothetical protein